MKQSGELNLIIKALSEANAEIINPKNTAVNPFFKKKYAPLDSIVSQVRPILTKHGLVIIQNVSTDDRFVSIETGIYHTSGQFIISDKLQMSAEKATAQGQGSAITYGRRYQLSAFLNISSEDDDDANHVSKDADFHNDGKSDTKKEHGNQKAILEIINKTKTIKELDSLVQQRTIKTWTESELKEQNEAMEKVRNFIKEAQ